MTDYENLGGIPGNGTDADVRQRPGVPMETDPHPAGEAHWDNPEPQIATVHVLKRAGLENLTPVFGTGEPPRGLSGAMRVLAYKIPEHRVSHWAILLVADRVDVLEHGDRRRVAKLAALAAGVALFAIAARRALRA